MRGDSEMMGVRSANQSPQSVGSTGMDSGIDSLPEQMGDLSHVGISLCGGLTDNREITRGRTKNGAMKGETLYCGRKVYVCCLANALTSRKNCV